MADRTPRKSATRETESRRKPWAPPSHLAAPTPPDGFVHRWIRVAMRGEEDKMNVNAKLREGWEPVRKDEYPDYEAPDYRRWSLRGCHRTRWTDAVPYT